MGMTYNGREAAKLGDIRFERAEPGLGAARLIFCSEFRAWPIPEGSPALALDVVGGVLRAKSLGTAGRPKFLGPLSVESGDRVVQYNRPAPHPRHVYLALELTPTRLAALESMRGGGDMELEFTLRGTVACEAESQWGEENRKLKVTQSDWVSWLAAMELQETLLLEVPVYPGAFEDEFKKAAQFMKDAQTHLLKGHNREVFVSCRHALEAVGHVLGDGNGTKKDLKTMIEKPQELPKRERLMVMRRATYVMACLASHAKDDVSLRTDWDSSDARGMLTTTAGILQWAADAVERG